MLKPRSIWTAFALLVVAALAFHEVPTNVSLVAVIVMMALLVGLGWLAVCKLIAFVLRRERGKGQSGTG